MPPRSKPSYVGAAEFLPPGADLATLAAAATGCRGCDLHALENQTVFGEGPPQARVVLVGEQPGDQEDRRGRPFVGPAGQLLDRALAEAGVDREQAYVTNAVKHFKYRAQGKRRIHQTPDTYEVAACSAWLTAELAVLDPEVVVALGATAAKALLGPSFKVTQQRGQLFDWPPTTGGGVAAPDAPEPDLFAPEPEEARRSTVATATIHPSAVLRADDDARDAAFAGLVADLRVVAGVLS